MGQVIPFPKKPGRSKEQMAIAAQKAVEQGMSPNHPALRNIVRDNVTPLKPKS
jgi:hypothetical protein